MTTSLRFGISDLVPYINWVYFYHAWGVKEEHAAELRAEAQAMLSQWGGQERETLFRVRLMHAHSSGEDIILYDDEDTDESESVLCTLPLLRQQCPPYLCLADFVPPKHLPSDIIGVFASTVPFPVDGLLEQTLADRLAEASAELGHELVRKSIWAYSPDEALAPQDMFAEHYQGKRPAVGYPSLPDQSTNFILGPLLDFASMGISLTENGAMMPHACTTGLMISHPGCRHFKVGTIGEDQLHDYAVRRGLDAEYLRKFLDVADTGNDGKVSNR